MKSSVIMGKSMNLIYIAAVLLLASVFVSTLYRKEIKETFTLLGSSLSYSMGEGVRSSWLSSDKKPKDNNVYSNMDTNVTVEGSNESDMLIFNNNKFSPDCCPSAYSSSTGCLCATPEQMKYLNSHGGNRTLGGAPSEF